MLDLRDARLAIIDRELVISGAQVPVDTVRSTTPDHDERKMPENGYMSSMESRNSVTSWL